MEVNIMYEPVFDKNHNVIGYISPSGYERKIVMSKDGLSVIGYYNPDTGFVMDDQGKIVGSDTPYPPYFDYDKHKF